MRRLIHVPIIHSAVDLGSLSESVKAHYAKVVGGRAWSQREKAVAEIWKHIRQSIKALRLDDQRVRIYQDGLPVCGFEEKIVRELAEAGSCNHQLIVELLNRGAMLEGTEDPQLLMEEYEMQKRHMEKQAVSDHARQQRIQQADRLLEARDRFIAIRINETLQAGETGLLFLGTLHRLDTMEAADIKVEPLVDPSGDSQTKL